MLLLYKNNKNILFFKKIFFKTLKNNKSFSPLFPVFQVHVQHSHGQTHDIVKGTA
jgi:hypothetical protein